MKEKKISMLTISISLLLSLITFIYGYPKIEGRLRKHLEIAELEKKRKLESDYTDIKIGIDYNSFTKPKSLSDNNYNKLISLINETTAEFPKFLKIQHTNIDITSKIAEIKTACKVEKLGSEYNKYLIENDLFIIPKFDETLKNEVIATASYCFTHSSNSRPIIGTLQLSPNLDFEKENENVFLKNVIFHEIIHILGFDSRLFSKLGMMTRYRSVNYINSKRVLSRARQHFNCENLVGIPLESQTEIGEPGTHWDARVMLGDIMISNYYVDNALSDITLALLEDTQFYKVNYYSGGLFKFGKNKGCDFLNEKCILNNKVLFEEEFCKDQDTPKCSPSKINKGKCIIHDYDELNMTIPKNYQYFSNPYYGGFYAADFCPVADSSDEELENKYYPGNCRYGKTDHPQEYGEIFGEESFCFLSSLTPSSSNVEITNKAMCYKVECNDKTKQLVVYVGDSTFICPTNGGITVGSGYKGILTCPKYYDICGTQTAQLCNDIFDCLNKKLLVDEKSYDFPSGTNNFDRYVYSGSSSNIKFSFHYLLINIALLLLI